MIEWSSGHRRKFNMRTLNSRHVDRLRRCVVNLSFTDNQRVIHHPTVDKTLETFTFDGEGRLWKHDFQNGSDPAEEELFMKETEKYPVKKLMTIYDSPVTITEPMFILK